jgi:hypothetical protein
MDMDMDMDMELNKINLLKLIMIWVQYLKKYIIFYFIKIF